MSGYKANWNFGTIIDKKWKRKSFSTEGWILRKVLSFRILYRAQRVFWLSWPQDTSYEAKLRVQKTMYLFSNDKDRKRYNRIQLLNCDGGTCTDLQYEKSVLRFSRSMQSLYHLCSPALDETTLFQYKSKASSDSLWPTHDYQCFLLFSLSEPLLRKEVDLL